MPIQEAEIDFKRTEREAIYQMRTLALCQAGSAVPLDLEKALKTSHTLDQMESSNVYLTEFQNTSNLSKN